MLIALLFAWNIEITTTGGIAGNGSGTVTLSSDGVAMITHGAQRCAYRVPPDELAAIDAAVRSAQPAQWEESYEVARCCDLIRTTVKLRRGRNEYLTSSLTGATFPSDLENLVARLKRYRALCR